jgi:ribulose-5-phosphate 4-epimerase/fuculose-1-phosphate aldolase
MQIRVSPENLDYSAEEWQARVDLAAAHRLAFIQGFSEGIFNHLTLTVPGRKDLYYQIPFGMHWSEVTASSLMEVGIADGKVKRGSGDVERSCYCIHAPIHKALPQAAAVFHTHMPYASALTRLKDPRIKEIGQTEVGLSDMIAYDDQYTGPAFEPAEGERLAKVIGNKAVLFMANHGITTLGNSVAEAYDRLYYLRGAGADLRHVDAPASEGNAGRGRRENQARNCRRELLRRPQPGAAALRCAQAHARSVGARLQEMIFLSLRNFTFRRSHGGFRCAQPTLHITARPLTAPAAPRASP